MHQTVNYSTPRTILCQVARWGGRGIFGVSSWGPALGVERIIAAFAPSLATRDGSPLRVPLASTYSKSTQLIACISFAQYRIGSIFSTYMRLRCTKPAWLGCRRSPLFQLAPSRRTLLCTRLPSSIKYQPTFAHIEQRRWNPFPPAFRPPFYSQLAPNTAGICGPSTSKK